MLNLSEKITIHQMQYHYFPSKHLALQSLHNRHAIATVIFEKDFASALKRRLITGDGPQSRPVTTNNVNISETNEDYLEDPDSSLEVSTESETIFPEETSNENLMNGTRRKRRNANTEEEYEDEEEENYDEHYLRTSKQTLNQSTIKVYLDNSNSLVSLPVWDMLKFGSWKLVNKVNEDNGRIPLTSPVVIREVVYGENTEASDFLLPGYMISFLYLSQVVLTSQLLIQERLDGFFDRAIVAGAKHSLLFFSHFLSSFIFALGQIGLMFLVGFVWYRMPHFGSMWLSFGLVTLQATSSIMTGKLSQY